jgi:hypothetical protein
MREGTFINGIDARNADTVSTIAPPRMAQHVGLSPSASIAHIGLKMGSITGINTASSAETYRIARA